MKTPAVGIIGCAGRIGRIHAETIALRVPECTLKWVCDTNVDEARAIARRFDIPHFAATYHEMLCDAELDAVLICSPTPTRVSCILDSAQLAGKHIFCEKPVDLAPQPIVAAIAAARKDGVKLQVGFMKRFDPEYARLKAMLDAGAVGEPHIIRISSRDPAPPPAEYVEGSGGLFRDMTCHDFDLLRYLTESEFEEVQVFAAVRVAEFFREAKDHDTAIVSFRLQNGAIGCIDNSRKANYGYDQRVELFGPNGCVIADHAKPTHCVALTENGIVADKPKIRYIDRYLDAYVGELRHFVEVLGTDREPLVTAMDSLKAILIADAVEKSIEEQRVVKVDYSLCEL